MKRKFTSKEPTENATQLIASKLGGGGFFANKEDQNNEYNYTSPRVCSNNYIRVRGKRVF